MIGSIVVSLLTAGLGPLLGWIAGRTVEGSRTITAVRAVQGLSAWAILGAILSNADFWVAVIPPVQRFVSDNWSETLVGGAAGLSLSIIFELLRRVTSGGVPGR